MKKVFLYTACVVLLLNGGKELWDLINFGQYAGLNAEANTVPYKAGLVVGSLLKIVVFFGLIKIIYDHFLKSSRRTVTEA